LAVAAVGLIGALWCLFTDAVPAVWPATRIERREKPGAFWSYVAFYAAVMVGGLIYALTH
jgi:hypothetical protein